VYYLPIWFQAIKGVSAVNSGIMLLPLSLSMVAASMLTGVAVSKTGYYTPFMIAGSCLLSIGAGLLTTLQLDTEQAKWVGYQFLYGFGMGMTFQAPNLAAQTVLPMKDVSIGVSLMFFTQLLGGAIFISVGQNVLNNELLKRLTGLPGFNPSMVEDTGATNLITSLPADLRQPVLTAYNGALRVVFIVGLCLACLIILGACAMEWRSVKEKKPVKPADPETAGVQASTEERDGGDTATKSDADTLTAETTNAEKAKSVEGTFDEAASSGDHLPVRTTTGQESKSQ
jgi:MFS family permease